jgi:hypothetical protein
MSDRFWGWTYLIGVVYYPVRTWFILSGETTLTLDDKFFIAVMAIVAALGCIKWAAEFFSKIQE